MRKFILILLILFVARCSGNSLITDAAISAAEDLKTVTLVSIHHPEDVDGEYPDLMEEDGTRLFTNDSGVEINLTEATIHWDAFELVSGGDDEDCLDDLDENFTLDVEENILDEDFMETTLAERDDIPNLSYCQFVVTISSVTTAGTWSDSTSTGAFEINVTEEISVSSGFQTEEDGEVIEHPLHFGDDEDSATVTLSNEYDQWFHGINFTETTEELATMLQDNIEATLHQHTRDHHGE